ncbi:Plasma membrane proteolipid [Lachnellula willkommii]|uniref:Plasma membrane proteolipid n=1 Tax=Lachnellula willkommii TaxID=215461 RepID=A0A559M1P3_9HELO|nr:Plasma membrane proteolipid [Lachnellula willkommii]
MPFTASDICKILLAIFLPPLGVFLERGCGADLLINILLTILGYIPGIIHALYVHHPKVLNLSGGGLQQSSPHKILNMTETDLPSLPDRTLIMALRASSSITSPLGTVLSAGQELFAHAPAPRNRLGAAAQAQPRIGWM